jgi:imidazole glycerol-phosphate synthase subunit HisH
LSGDTVIVESGGANTASLQFALRRLNASSRLSADPAAISAAARVILPGVGAAADAMNRLRDAGLCELIPKLSQPVLGICLGMQLLFEYSEEGATQCLGVIPGRAARFADAANLPIPHMGWNTLEVTRPSRLLAGISNNDYAYFVHSYRLPIGAATVATADYAGPFSACVEWHNFYGTQFHPERSSRAGAAILRNFLSIN